MSCGYEPELSVPHQARSQRKQRELVADLLRVIAADPVPDRPGRGEPRVLKRRPKPFPLLNKPRHQFQEIPHYNRYWKVSVLATPSGQQDGGRVRWRDVRPVLPERLSRRWASTRARG